LHRPNAPALANALSWPGLKKNYKQKLWRRKMSIIMMLYYVISAFIAGMIIWNFVREKEDKEKMLLYLIVLIPFILRILRIR
jgi:uncharacterized membrane protein YbjE (DUF340 family)